MRRSCSVKVPSTHGDRRMNFQILASVTRALKERAKFIFTTLNVLRPLVHYHTLYGQNGGQESNANDAVFDLVAMLRVLRWYL